jgi:hypothetical protein
MERLIVASLLFMASQTAPAVGTRSDPCDPKLSKLAEKLPNGYAPRHDNPDQPCCEGKFREEVGGQVNPNLELVEYSFGDRAKSLTASTTWEISWPAVGTQVFIRGSHARPEMRYRIDAGGDDTAAKQAGEPGRFRWSCARAAEFSFSHTDVLFCVSVPDDRLDKNSPIYLPAQIKVDAGAAPVEAKPPVPEAPLANPLKNMRLLFVANKQVPGVRFTAVSYPTSAGEQPQEIGRRPTTFDPAKAQSVTFDRTKFKGKKLRVTAYYTHLGIERELKQYILELPDDASQTAPQLPGAP